MNLIWKIIGGAAVLLVIIFSGQIGKIVGKTTTENYFEGKNESELNSVLMQAASQLNKNLPVMVDAETRLDAALGMNKQFRYNYTLVNYTAEELDPNTIIEALEEKLINNVCTTKEMEIFVSNGVDVTYAYYGKNGKQITTITVQPLQCKNS